MHTTLKPNAVRAYLLLSATMLAGSAAAAPQFLPAKAGDLVPKQIVAPTAAPDMMQKSVASPELSREAVTMSWAVQGDIVTAPQTFVAQSREYYAEVSADELAAGVTIHTTSPRAVVRLQPLTATSRPREKLAIHPQSLVLTNAAGRSFDAGSGMEMLVSADKLNKADLPFAEGTSAFRIHKDLGAGALKLRAPELQGSDRYLVNVVEPESKLALTMQTDAPSYLHGQQLTIMPELVEQDGTVVKQRHALGKLTGYVTSPAGRNFPVTFKVDKDGRMRARLPIDADEAPAPGLWEVHASGPSQVNGQTVIRSARLAFGVAMPVARLNGSAVMVNEPGSVGVGLGVEVGAAGRYETRGLLYGMSGGVMKPLAVAHAAQWMEPGTNQIVLRYSSELLAGATGPFEVRDLTLLDQGRMGVLQRQQQGLTIDERDIVRTAAPATAAKQPVRTKQPPVNS